MVRLTRIYTRTGDAGETALGDGTRVPKTHVRIAAYGSVDELNSVLGMVVLQRGLARADRELLRGIQNDLFDVGADLCVPRKARENPGDRLRVVAEQVLHLEQAIDARNERLQPLTSFVLPGGRAAAAWLHVARAVCRRAELQVAALQERAAGKRASQVLPYLNRLSDLLFVMARCANDDGRADVLWVPGAGRTPADTTQPSRRKSATAPKRTRSPRARGQQRAPQRGARKRR